MVNTGPDAFFARIGRSALINTMVLPSASYGVKKVLTAGQSIFLDLPSCDPSVSPDPLLQP